MHIEIEQDVIDKIVTNYKNNMSIKKLSMMFDIEMSEIIKILSERNFRIRNSKYTVDQDDIKEVARLHALGYSARKIGREINRDNKTVQRILGKELGVFTNRLKILAHNIEDGFTKDYEDGMTYKDLSKKYNLNNDDISMILDYLKISRKRKESSGYYAKMKRGYFNELTNNKAYILGLIYSFARIERFEKINIIYLRCNEKYRDVLDVIIDEIFCDKATIKLKNKLLSVKIEDKVFTNELIELGLFDRINVPIDFYYSFMDGFFVKELSVAERFIRIKYYNKKYREFIVEYLEYFVGFKVSNRMCETLEIYANKNIRKLIEYHPIVLDKIEDTSYEKYRFLFD